MSPAHRALRAATSEAHARVDAVFGGFDMRSRAGYAACLAAHAEALLPWEDELDASAAEKVVGDWHDRRRGALILGDLAELRTSHAPDQGQVEKVEPQSHSFSETNMSLPSIAGALYVLEGSRHGGKYIARSLPESFPRRYLDADQPAGNWGFLLSKLDNILYAREPLQTAVDTALQVFLSFETAGRKWLVKDGLWPS